MGTRESLAVRGHAGDPVAHTFRRGDQGTDHLAVLLPGLDYSAHMPALYYPGRLLADRGADVLSVEYAYGADPSFLALAPAERLARLFADVEPLFAAAVARSTYARVTLVAKSLGTLAAARLLDRCPEAERSVVWLTPLLRNARLCSDIGVQAHRALFVTGTADPHYDGASLEALRAATGGDAVVIDGADHSLEIPGDLAASVEAMARVVRAVARFVG